MVEHNDVVRLLEHHESSVRNPGRHVAGMLDGKDRVSLPVHEQDRHLNGPQDGVGVHGVDLPAGVQVDPPGRIADVRRHPWQIPVARLRKSCVVDMRAGAWPKRQVVQDADRFEDRFKEPAPSRPANVEIRAGQNRALDAVSMPPQKLERQQRGK